MAPPPGKSGKAPRRRGPAPGRGDDRRRGPGRGPPSPFPLQLQPAFESRPPTRLACSPPFNPAQDGRGTWGRRGSQTGPRLGAGPWSLRCLSVFLRLLLSPALVSLASHDLHASVTTSFSLCPEKSRCPPAWAGSRDIKWRDTFCVSLCTRRRTAPTRSAVQTKGREATWGGRGGGGADRGAAPGARRGQCQAWVRLFAPTKEETAQRAGSAWSGSPREEVGVGTRTRALGTLGNHRIVSLGERLRSRQHLRDRDGDRQR